MASQNDTEDTTNPACRTFRPDHSHQQSDIHGSYELRTMDTASDQDREQALKLPAESTEDIVMESIERDDDRRSPERHVSIEPQSPIQIVSDDEVASDRSQKTGMDSPDKAASPVAIN